VAATRTPSGSAPWRPFTVGCRPFPVLRRTPCRTPSRPFRITPFPVFSWADQHRAIGWYGLSVWSGGEDTPWTSHPDPAAHGTRRGTNGVRRREGFGPLSQSIPRRLRSLGPLPHRPPPPLPRIHPGQASRVSCDPNQRIHAPVATLRRPNGTRFAVASRAGPDPTPSSPHRGHSCTDVTTGVPDPRTDGAPRSRGGPPPRAGPSLHSGAGRAPGSPPGRVPPEETRAVPSRLCRVPSRSVVRPVGHGRRTGPEPPRPGTRGGICTSCVWRFFRRRASP
jgi:hypothetical protein